MDKVLEIIFRILYYIFIVMIIQSIFRTGRRSNNRERDDQRSNFSNDQHQQSSSDDYYSNEQQFNQEEKSLIQAYKIMGVSTSATDADIKKKYRELAKKYHPDVNGSKEAQKKMSEINNAYDLITEKRKIKH
ncbi:DnaJ domain-containing protein [Spiroplasma tabanidicola]|uniref:DnaJ family protein n=1 Tax=Spiroplasma tabanidicola TaxID=324079 RepID=A0A6I6CBG4_9MOLU|nr:DnaJ domain-containing protein [Spiroplasma tabanidicola]QGS52291.1 DnaJ family protein [Spiroplasma tabanidicola]